MIYQMDSRDLAYMAICLHPTCSHGDSPTPNSPTWWFGYRNLPTQPLTNISYLFLITIFLQIETYSRNYLKKVMYFETLRTNYGLIIGFGQSPISLV